MFSIAAIQKDLSAKTFAGIVASIFAALAKWGRVLSNPFEIKNFVHSTAVFTFLLQVRLCYKNKSRPTE